MHMLRVREECGANRSEELHTKFVRCRYPQRLSYDVRRDGLLQISCTVMHRKGCFFVDPLGFQKSEDEINRNDA